MHMLRSVYRDSTLSSSRQGVWLMAPSSSQAKWHMQPTLKLLFSCWPRKPLQKHCQGVWQPRTALRCYATERAALSGPLDLTACIPRGSQWDNVHSWVVFSDLHVSTKTVQVCCQVLKRVHAEARTRQAGILFLGDFWHARGSLPVDPLNLVLREIQTWRQPTLMLVGNHDQVTLGGTVHALTPLAAACPALHVFEQPTLWKGVLWLPYRRDGGELEAAIHAAGPIKALFGHADVLGAMVNENFQAREGLDPELFPLGVPSFLGHYHKPHTVQGSQIRYVGSPYQVSWGESGQVKQLLVLDELWQQIDAVPLDIGPRHFHIEGACSPVWPPDMRAGDRLKWILPEGMSAETAEAAAQAVQQQGVEVEVIARAASESPRIEQAEDLGALALFHIYADRIGMSAEARSRGVHILQDIEGGPKLSHSTADVSFLRLELEGYGPFRKRTEYELGGRGLRVVSGRNEDDSSADSNGAGKSALVMAALWCLTGRSDHRVQSGGSRGLTGAELVHDDSRSARVRVEGEAKGQPFWVERTVTRRGLASLRFNLAGQDCSCQEARLTQGLVEQTLACSLLTRVVFHSQADITGLLEADDKEFKQELGRVVEMDSWDNAKAAAAERLRAAKQRATQLEQECNMRTAYLTDLRAKVSDVHLRAAQWDGSHMQRVEEAGRQATAAGERLHASLAALWNSSQQLQACLDDFSRSDPFASSASLQQTEEAEGLGLEGPRGPSVLLPAPAEPEGDRQEEQDVAGMRERLHQLQMQLLKERTLLGTESGGLQAAKRQLEEYSALQGRNSSDSMEAVCDRCLQPIDARMLSSNLARIAAEVAAVQQRVDEAQHNADRTEMEAASVRCELESLEASLREHARQQSLALQRRLAEDGVRQAQALQQASEEERLRQAAAVQVLQAQGTITRAAEVLHQLGPLIGKTDFQAASGGASTGILQPGSHDAVIAAMTASCQHTKQALACAEHAGSALRDAEREADRVTCEANPCSGEVAVLEGLILSEASALEGALQQASTWDSEAGWLGELDSAFGRTGVQSFALEGILGELQDRTAVFLQQLSSRVTLTLSASRPVAKGKDVPAMERITKAVHVRTALTASGHAVMRERSVRQLSGGERRRVALALSLGFASLIAARSRLRCNLLVLDEVLQQLDEEGCSRMVRVLKSLPQASVLIVGQANSFITSTVDMCDIVVKRDGCSYIELSP